MHAFLIADDVKAWISSNDKSNSFAKSLALRLKQQGHLSINQIEAVKRSIENDKAKVNRITNTAQEKIEGFDALAKAFDAAKANGLKKPKMRFEGFEAKLAPASGKNPGAIYLNADGLYLGKVIGGELHSTSDCKPDHLEKIRKAMKEPFKAAVEYGKATKHCSVCGLELTNKLSIELGIGPICREKFGL